MAAGAAGFQAPRVALGSVAKGLRLWGLAWWTVATCPGDHRGDASLFPVFPGPWIIPGVVVTGCSARVQSATLRHRANRLLGECWIPELVP